MIRFFLIVVIGLNVGQLIAADTSLIHVITFPKEINSIANDKYGNIFISFPDGIYKLIDHSGSTQLHDSRFNGTLLFLDSLIYVDPLTLGKEAAYQIKHIHSLKNLSWLAHLPLSDQYPTPFIAKDNRGYHYVSSRYHIYIFKVEELFTKYLPHHSTRGIQKWNDSIYLNTYRGLFKHQGLVSSKIKGGDLFSDHTDTLFASVGSYLYFLTPTEKRRMDLSDNFTHWAINYSNILQIGRNNLKEWVLGTDEGLAIVTEDSFQLLLENTVIEEIQSFENGFLLSTSNGIYTLDNQKRLNKLDIPINGCNQIWVHKNLFFIASETGLYTYNRDTRETSKISLLSKAAEPIRVYSLILDNIGFLWCGTNNGLIRIDLASNTFQHYLENTDFNKRSFFQEDDRIFMGTSNGTYTWRPLSFLDSLRENSSETFPTKLFAIGNKSTKKRLIFPIIFFGFTILIGILLLFRNFIKTPLENQKIRESQKGNILFQKEVNEFIDNHMDSVTVELLFTHFGMQKKEFYQKFDSYFHQTPGEYIRKKRKEKALSILKSDPNTDKSTLAKQVGYSERHIQNILDEAYSKRGD